MNTSPRSRHAFTLVELLVVITIIGILAGLITGAVLMARPAVKRAVIKSEIAQLEIALERYKAEVGEYPPDFAGLLDTDASVRGAARRAVLAHLRRRFPRCPLDPNPTTAWTQLHTEMLNNYGLDINNLDPASALAFWLGGLPDRTSGNMTPAGFHEDPENPFQSGLPRSKPFFEFVVDRYVPVENTSLTSNGYRYMRYYPAGSSSNIIGNQQSAVDPPSEWAPYVYFKSRRLGATGGRYEYALATNAATPVLVPTYYVHGPAAKENVAVPYLDEYPGSTPYWLSDPTKPAPASNSLTDLKNLDYIRRWRNLEKYQIICAGLDGQFGNVDEDPTTQKPDLYRFRFSKSGNNFTQDGFDYDNLTNFAKGTLEDEMQ